MPSPDPAVEERQYYLNKLGIADNPALSLADLRERTGGGARVDLAANFDKRLQEKSQLDADVTALANLSSSQLRGALDLRYALKTAHDAVDARLVTAENKITALEAKDICLLEAAALQSIPNSTTTVVTLATTVEDTNSMADLASNRAVIKKAGVYRASAIVNYTANATGVRAIYIYAGPSATPTIRGHFNMAAQSGQVNLLEVTTKLMRLAVNDIVQVRTFQSSGAALDAIQANGIWPCLSVEYVRA